VTDFYNRAVKAVEGVLYTRQAQMTILGEHGGNTEIHYWEHLETGTREGFKFK
jgi:aminoglycoside N3'-acetyltransferase